MSFEHQRDVLGGSHVVGVRGEALLTRGLGLHLADRLQQRVTRVDLHVHRIRQEVVDLLQDLARWNVRRRWILEHHVNLLESVRLVQCDASPVVLEHILWHLDPVDVPVQIHRQPDRFVAGVAL